MVATEVSDGPVLGSGPALHRAAGLSALLAAACCILQIVIEVIGVAFMGIPVPADVPGWYALLQRYPLLGLTELTALQVPAFALCSPVFVGLYDVLRGSRRSSALIATVWGFIGIAVYLASNTAFALLHLSAKYAGAGDAAQRAAALAAGEAMLAVYQGVGVDVGLPLVMVSVLMVSAPGLRGGFPGVAVGWAGILAAFLTVLYFISSAFSTQAIFVLEVADLFFVIWLILAGRALLRYQGTGRPEAAH